MVESATICPMFLLLPLAVGLAAAHSFRDMLLATRCERLPLAAEDELITKFKMRLYYGAGASDYEERPLAAAAELAASPRFDARRCTAFVVHGFLATPDTEHVREIVQAYAACRSWNVLALEWAAATAGALPYAAAAAAVPAAAPAVARALAAFTAPAVAGGVGRGLCHAAGVGLGAHLQGLVARALFPLRLPLLAGLDPAFPLFYNATVATCAHRLHAADADCVVALHTNGGELGSPHPVGDSDVFPNGGGQGGAPQPGCLARDFSEEGAACSHWAAARLWAEAQCPRGAQLLGRRCSSWLRFRQGGCDAQPTLHIAQCDRKPGGRYYLSTNAASPFGRGAAGAAETHSLSLHSAAPPAQPAASFAAALAVSAASVCAALLTRERVL